MYFILLGFLVPALFIGARTASKNETKEGAFQAICGYVIIVIMYIIGALLY